MSRADDNLRLEVWELTLKSCKEWKTDLVEMSYHNCCCAECSKHQGRVFSISGKDKRFPKLPDVVLKTGGMHNGCSHNFRAFHYGVTSMLIDTADKKHDPIEYSNRHFTDEREPWEKTINAHILAEIQIKSGNYEKAINIIKSAIADDLPSILTTKKNYDLEKTLKKYLKKYNA